MTAGIKYKKRNGLRESTPSQEVDSFGNQLSPEQVKFFANSKVRDSKGNLLVCYHGTPNTFDEFRISNGQQGKYGSYGIYFSDETTARGYGSTKGYYLNANKVLYVNANGNPAVRIFTDIVSKGRTGKGEATHIDDIAYYADEHGYDGVIVDNVRDNFDNDSTGHIGSVYIVFNPNQIKSITNTNPTNSNNINEDAMNTPVVLYRGKGNNNNPTNKYSGGRFYATSIDDASEYGNLIQVVELSPNAKILKYDSSYDYCEDNGILDKEYDIIPKLTNGFRTLRDAYEELVWNGETPNLYYMVSQYILSQELSRQGYDGANWRFEDDLIPNQYQIWNENVIKHIKDVDENGNELKENMDNKLTPKQAAQAVKDLKLNSNPNINVYIDEFSQGVIVTFEGVLEGGKKITLWDSNILSTQEQIDNLPRMYQRQCDELERLRAVGYRGIKESNELKQMAKKHKKKAKGIGWHMSMNAGDVEKGMEVFNNSTSANCVTGDCGAGMGESLDESNGKGTYYYDGPVYYRGHKIADSSSYYTTAPSYNVALRNILYQAARGDKELYHYDIVDDMVRLVKADKSSYELKPNREKCHRCGYELNDIGDCPVCDYGEDDLLESLSDLEALWSLNNMDLD